jgi:putative endopeptidase
MRILTITMLLLPAAMFGQQPLTTLPYTPSLDIPSMDRSVAPCDNFYKYACGGWMKNNPIPGDQATWSVYGKLTYENQLFLWGLLEQAGDTSVKRSSSQQKIGDFFHACMDEATAEKAGADPIQAELQAIDELKSLKDLPALVAKEHLTFYASSTLFNFGSNQDFADSSQVIAFAGAGGLGLPDRDYYTKTDAKSEEKRQKYVAHVQQMFELLGDTPDAAAARAKAVMRIETALAKASLTRV